MTRQTTAPLEEFRRDVRHTTMRELVRMHEDGWLTLDAPYQRGPVWDDDQRIALVRSWMTGVPIPSIITNDRTSSWWTGPKPQVDGNPLIAVVDGKQRILAGLAWFQDGLAVPATWFPADAVTATEEADDDVGPYVRYSYLTRSMQTHIAFSWTIPVTEGKVADVQAEAALYLLVNGGGVLQTADDMDRAARVARGES